MNINEATSTNWGLAPHLNSKPKVSGSYKVKWFCQMMNLKYSPAVYCCYGYFKGIIITLL